MKKQTTLPLDIPLTGIPYGFAGYPEIKGGNKKHHIRERYFELVSKYVRTHNIPLKVYFEYSYWYEDRGRIHFVSESDRNNHEYLYLTDDVLKKDYVKETLKIWNKYRGVSNEEV